MAPKAKKGAKKAGATKKVFKKNGGSKSTKPPTLKQKQARVNKIIKADQLMWKPVDIPDNLGDYSGFFGLEELEGVDVRMVNGKAEFIGKEESDDENKGDEKDEEFAGFEDEEDEAKEGDADAVPVKEKTKKERKNDERKEKKKQDAKQRKYDKKMELKAEKEKEQAAKEEQDEQLDESLFANAFAALDMPLPDSVDLPEWASTEVSAFTLSGLQGEGFTTPTPIQKKTIPLAMLGKDVIGKATTGSGKTLAYGIPILEKYISKIAELQENRKNNIVSPPTGIIFAPTRELAHQVVDHLNKIAKYSPLSQHGIVSITGGLSIQRQERLLGYSPGIIVATPGRFLELLEKSSDLATRLSSTDIVVLDEADRLLQDGHFEEFEKILELFGKHRPKLCAWRWQTLVFSATFSRDLFGKLDKTSKHKPQKNRETGLIANDEILELLAKKLRFKDPKPALCDANPKEIVSGQVTEALVECGATERDLYLYYFVLMYPGSTLVFANSVDSVKRLVPFLQNLNVPAFSIHSGMMQKQRLRALEKFKESTQKSKNTVLIASDVAARGLDIPNIDHVAHYHLPRSADIYIHRSGRTARAGKEGVSVMFCSPQEASGPLRKLRKLMASSAENTKFDVKENVQMLPIDHDLVSQIKERVAISSKLGNSTISNTATRKEDSWLKQAADDLGIENLAEVDVFEDDVIKKQRKRQEKNMLTKEEQKGLRFQLKQLLATPLRKNHRRSYLTSGLENLAHQIVTGVTSETILGRKLIKALDELKGKPKRVDVKKTKKELNKIAPKKVAKPQPKKKEIRAKGKK